MPTIMAVGVGPVWSAILKVVLVDSLRETTLMVVLAIKLEVFLARLKPGGLSFRTGGLPAAAAASVKGAKFIDAG